MMDAAKERPRTARGEARPYRHELKYIINAGEHALLSRRLQMTMAQDAYAAQSGGEYHIRSLYFDDPDDSAIRDKLDGLDTRDKIRIRIYNGSDRTIKLERKRKDGAYVQKSSLRLTRQECDALLKGDCRFLLGRPEPFAGQMFGILKLRQLRPRVLVDYDREPYVFPAEDVRITFDKNLRTALRATALFDPDVPTYPVTELRNCMIMEVKFNRSLPAYVQMLIQTGAAQRTAASKYLFCRQYEF